MTLLMMLPSLANVNQEVGKWSLPDSTNQNGIGVNTANVNESSSNDTPSLAGSLKAAEDDDEAIDKAWATLLERWTYELFNPYEGVKYYFYVECSEYVQNIFIEEVQYLDWNIRQIYNEMQLAYEQKTILDQFNDLDAKMTVASSQIIILRDSLQYAQSQYEADAARRQANDEAYAADLATLQALRDELEAAVTTIQENYPNYNYIVRYDAIMNVIQTENEGVENEYQSVQESGNYSYEINSALIRSMIEDMLQAAKDISTGIESVSVTEMNDGDRIFTLQGQQVANPISGQVNIIVKADGSRKKVFVK